MASIRIISSRTMNLPAENVDTDQIYPARFLTTTERKSLGQYCFLDWRSNPESRFYKYFQYFQPETQQVLVSGRNFGCGSSREHAAWSLLDMGFKAVISSRFGDIFQSNALKNGLVLVQVGEAALGFLLDHDQLPVTIDIEQARLEIPGFGEVVFELDDFSAYCLLNGIDSLDYLRGKLPNITEYEQRFSK